MLCPRAARRGRNEEGHRARRVMEHEFDGIPEKHSASEQTRDGAEHDEIRLSRRENFFPAERETLTCDSTRSRERRRASQRRRERSRKAMPPRRLVMTGVSFKPGATPRV